MKIALAFFLAAGALFLGAAPSSASAPHGPAGVVVHAGSPAPRAAATIHASSGPLAYQGGKIMETNTVYAIYWMPAGSRCSGSLCDTGTDPYETAINQYFTDVAADSGTNGNVYSVATQYCQGVAYHATSCGGGGTPIAYHETFGGAYVDSTPFPSSGCNDGSDAICLTDSQLQTEIVNDINANSWPKDTSQPSNLYFIYLPSGIGVCYDAGGSQCSSNYFCAYHDNFTSGGADIAYGVEPDNATVPDCTALNSESPNGAAVDPTINTTSHEHNEAITDPWPETSPGWWSNDAGEDEIGDLCAWNFGSPSGGSTGQEYNQVINGDHYWLQQEYSNASRSCVQSYTGTSLDLPSSTVPPVVTGTAAVGKTLLTTDGSWTGSPTRYSIQWQQCSSTGTSCANISSATGTSYKLAAGDAGHEIRSEVSATNAGGTSSPVPSTPTEAAVPVPAVTAAPVVSGVAAVGKTLSTTQGTWNTPVTYAYQWLRCSTAGGSCSAIAGATSSSYKLVAADRGHTLAARVSATNAAATTQVTSSSTATVVGVPAASRQPAISGKAKVGSRLSVNSGVWRDATKNFGYQWLRCGAGGGSCVRIHGATKSSYRLTRRDVRHRMRVQVVARNVAGNARSTSAASRLVKR